MKLVTTLFIFSLFATTSLFAQTNLSIGIHSGILFSAFEDQEETQTAIPVGGYLGAQVSESVELGAEFSTVLVPFEEKFLGETFSSTQLAFGGYIRVYFPMESIVPYIRGGVGYYTGAIEIDSDFGGLDFDYNGNVGFNVGAGFGTESGFYVEFIYHIVSQELKDFDGDAFGVNNFGGHVGYAFSIN